MTNRQKSGVHRLLYKLFGQRRQGRAASRRFRRFESLECRWMLNGDEPQVAFNLQVTDLNGNPITQVNVGDAFQLRALVEDVRPTGSRNGVFSAYQDVTFDGNLATASAISHSGTYGQGVSGTLSTGLIDEVGSFAPSLTPLGPSPQLLYMISMTATRTGTLTLTGNPPDVLPQHDIGVYGQDARVEPDAATYGSATLSIVNPNGIPENNIPVAVSDAVSAIEDSQNNIFDVLANDVTGSQPGTTLTISSVGAGSRGGLISVVENNTRVSYTPAANISGKETFTYTINGGGTTSSATVTVGLAAVNDPPDAKDDSVNVAKNSASNSLEVLANDLSTPDLDEILVVTAITQGDFGGVVEIDESERKIRYRPATGFLGTESFTYTMRDPEGLTDSATVNVTVRDFLPSSLAGIVYIDADNDGIKDAGEQIQPNVNIILTGNDSFGGSVTLNRTTDATGAYRFETLAPGTYKLNETQPVGELNNLPVVDGKDTIGSQGGTVSANDEFTITLAENITGTGNNFGELTGFKILGSVTDGFRPAQSNELAFSSVDVSLFDIDAENQSVGNPLKTAMLRSDGTFAFEGVAAGTYVLEQEQLTFLSSGSNPRVVTVNGADSLDNAVELGNRQAKYISYLDFMNSTPRKGIFASVIPGQQGSQWSALDRNWTEFNDAKVELNSDSTQVRIDLTRKTGEKLFTQIPITDHRVVTLAREGEARLLRIVGSSSDFILQPVTTTPVIAEGEGEGEGERIAAGQRFLTSLQTTIAAKSTVSLNSAPIASQPGPLDDASNSPSDVSLDFVSATWLSALKTDDRGSLIATDTHRAAASGQSPIESEASADPLPAIHAINAIDSIMSEEDADSPGGTDDQEGLVEVLTANL